MSNEIKHRFKYLGSTTPCFKTGVKYKGRVVSVDDCRRIQAIKFSCKGQTIVIEGNKVGLFKPVEKTDESS